MKECEYCKKLQDESYGDGRFCNKICATDYSKQFIPEFKNESCLRCGCDIQVKPQCDPKYFTCQPCKKIIWRENRKKNVKSTCIICDTIFLWYHPRKTCSKKCARSNSSYQRVKWLKENGTSNFATRQDDFNYKIAHNISLDSILEKAAIIYLIDVFGAEKIENFNDELQFEDEHGFKHFFLTDFYMEKGNNKYIVEVKMPWIGSCDHIYNKFIPNKKQALKEFCIDKGFEMLWLDFNYDKRFANIYTKTLSDRK